MNESLYIELNELISTMEQKVIFIDGDKFVGDIKTGVDELQNWLKDDWRIKEIVPQSLSNSITWVGKREETWIGNKLEEREEYGGFLIYLVK